MKKMDERTNLYGESTGVRHEAKDGKNNKSGKQGGDLIDKNIRMIVKNYVMKDAAKDTWQLSS